MAMRTSVPPMVSGTTSSAWANVATSVNRMATAKRNMVFPKVNRISSPALRIPAIQASRTPIHDHHGLVVALEAHGGGRREGRAVAGDFDVLAALGDGVGHDA